MRAQSVLLWCFVVVCNVNDQYLETLMSDKRLFVFLQALSQFLFLISQQLVAGFGGQQSKQSHQPERELFVLDLQNQQFEQITFHDVIVGKD